MARKTKKQDWIRQAPILILLAFGLVLLVLLQVIGDENLSGRETTQPDQDPSLEAYQSHFLEILGPKAQSIQENTGLLPSIILGQAILESDWGTSQLAQKENNLFGVKGTSSDPLYPTQEYYNGQMHTVYQHFKSYPSWEHSMEAHANLLVNGPGWDENHYQEVVQAGNYREAAWALQEAGYATDPNYAEKLIHVIESHELYRYD